VEDSTEYLRFLTLREAAEILQISQRTVLRLARRKELPGFKCGGRWRIRENELATWLEELHER
jgi:excisionase family DNA binding protein